MSAQENTIETCIEYVKRAGMPTLASHAAAELAEANADAERLAGDIEEAKIYAIGDVGEYPSGWDKDISAHEARKAEK